MDETAVRVGKNEAAFREANERIEAAADGMTHLAQIPFICECPIQSCTEIVRMTREEYEHVRSRGTTFWVTLGHEVESVDGVVVARLCEQHDRFTIMEKVGDAGAVAQALDPRGVRSNA
jgi:hypothetical protein